jgi:hypothetical protein
LATLPKTAERIRSIAPDDHLETKQGLGQFQSVFTDPFSKAVSRAIEPDIPA